MDNEELFGGLTMEELSKRGTNYCTGQNRDIAALYCTGHCKTQIFAMLYTVQHSSPYYLVKSALWYNTPFRGAGVRSQILYYNSLINNGNKADICGESRVTCFRDMMVIKMTAFCYNPSLIT